MSIECFGGQRPEPSLFDPVEERPVNVESARNAAEFVRLCAFDKAGRVTVALCPGHECKVYECRFGRDEKGGMIHVLSCTDVSNNDGCKGNRHGICYHSIAALIRAAGVKGHTLSFCETREDAEMLLRVGGKVLPIRASSGKQGWVVYRKAE